MNYQVIKENDVYKIEFSEVNSILSNNINIYSEYSKALKALKSLNENDYYVQLAKDYYGYAVQDNSKEELIYIGRLIDSGEDLEEKCTFY